MIAGQTKIKVSLLEGLERDDLAHWPPGIFRRAYVRSYANAIGLNVEAVVNEFLSVYPETPEVIDGAPSSDGTASTNGAPTRLRHLLGSAVGSLSRLRRGSPVEEPMRPQGTTGSGLSLSLNTPPPAPVAAAEPEPVAVTEPIAVPEIAVPEPIAVTEPIVITEPEARASPEPPAEVAEKPMVDLLAAAELCTALGRVENANQMPPLLRDAAAILDARGLIVWVWDSIAEELQPALVYGYPDKLVAQLPRLKPDADNLTAAAFRSSETLAIGGNAEASAALAVPMQIPGGCAGVLALELSPGCEDADPVRAVAIVFAAMLAQLVGGAPAASSQPVRTDGDRPARSQMSTAV